MSLSERTFYVLRVARSLLLAMLATGLIVLAYNFLRYRFPQMPDVKLETVLAFLAIAFALVQFFDSKRQEGEMVNIALSMSTRFVGCFPKNLKEITATVNKASTYLYVIVDFIGYAQYSAPRDHSDYLDAVERALGKRVDVRVIVYDQTLGARELAEQIPDRDGWFAEECEKPRFKHYFEINKGLHKSTNSAELRQILFDQQEASRKGLCTKGAQVSSFSESAAFFLWMEDDEEAVFAFKNAGNTERGLSFKTQDANLIRQFKDIFDRRWNKLQEGAAAAAPPPVTSSAALKLAPAPEIKKDAAVVAQPAGEGSQQPGTVAKNAGAPSAEHSEHQEKPAAAAKDKVAS